MPELTFNPFDERTISGVLKFPIQLRREDNDDIEEVRDESGRTITPEFIAAYFKQSLCPTPESLHPHIGKQFDLLKSKRHVYDIMLTLGPGIYYFGACRSGDTAKRFQEMYAAETGKAVTFASAEEAYAALPRSRERTRMFAKHRLRRAVSKEIQSRRRT